MYDPVAEELKRQVNQAFTGIRKQFESFHKQLAAVQKRQDEIQAIADPGLLAENMPGKRVPFMYHLEYDFAAAATAQQLARFTTSQDGHFLCLALMSSVRVPQAGANVGRWRPPSSITFNIDGTGYGPGPMDFSFEIQDRNSDRMWQNAPTPSCYLFTAQGKPLYLTVPAFIEKNTTVSGAVTPTRQVDEACRLVLTFAGYKIIDPTPYRP